MLLNRLELLQALTIAKSTTSNNPISPILGCFCFTGNALITFDGVRSTIVPFETEFVGGVPSVLYNVVSKYKGEELSIENMGATIQLKCGRSKDELVLIPAESFLWEAKKEATSMTLSLSSLMYASLKTLLVCADKNCLHTNTNGIYLVKKGRSVYFAASDSNVIGIKRMSSIRLRMEDFCILLPYGFIELLGGLDFEHNIELQLHPTSVSCWDKEENIVINTKLVAFSNMPDCLGFMEQAAPFLEMELPEDFLDTIERAVCLEKNVTKPIEFLLSPGQLTLSAKSTLGSVQECFDVDSERECTFNFNGGDILPLFKNLEFESLHFCSVSGLPSMLLVTDGTDDAFKVLISSVGV